MNKGIKTAICLLIATAFIIPGASTIGNEPIVDEPKPEPEPLPTLIEAQSCLTDPEGARAPETPPHEPTGFDAINMETGESPPEPSRDEGDIIFEQMPVSPDYPSWSLPFSDLHQGPGYRVYDNFTVNESIGDVSWWGLEAYGDNDVTGDVFEVAFFLDDGGIPDLGNPQYDFTGMEVGVNITASAYPNETDPWIFVGYKLFYYEMELPEVVDMPDGWFSVYRTTSSSPGSAWAWDQDPKGEGMDDYRYHEFVSPPEEWDDVAFRLFSGVPPPQVNITDLRLSGRTISVYLGNDGWEDSGNVTVSVNATRIFLNRSKVFGPEVVTVAANGTERVDFKWWGFGHYHVTATAVGDDVYEGANEMSKDVWWFLFFGFGG
jgi:hypothetical protein